MIHQTGQQNMKTSYPISLVAGTVIMLSGVFNAVAGNSPYWVGSDGKYVRSGFGECVRTIDWTAEKAIAGCEGGRLAAQSGKDKKMAAAGKSSTGKAAGGRKSAPIKPMPVVKAPVKKPAPAPQYRKLSLASGATFKLGGSTLSAEGKAAIAGLLKQFEGETIESVIVEGHTDDRGPAAFNQQLSEKRAEAVKAELVANGVDASLIKTVGHGESRPVASNDSREGRAKNRRVEIRVEAKKRQL
jgi:OOP family OmpA-OmpF porin